MDQGYKHFSHLHNLIMHQMPEGVEVQCSGCHSTATETVYVCWQCNFFLHDQCYRATRSLKHPSHPRHPLTLVPYPTYHSNSFYCNSCQIIGTGFSYSCADCEFDLHVQCAYSISRATSFKNSHLFQELVPQAWNSGHESLPIPFAGAQYNDYMHPNSASSHDPASVSIPHSNQNSTTTAHDPFKPYNLASVSIPTNYPQNTIPFSHDPLMPQGCPPDSIPTGSQNRISSFQYPNSMAQTGPSASIPSNYPPNKIPSSQDPSLHQDRPSDSIPTSSQNRFSSIQNPSISETGPSVSIPTSYPHNPIPSNQDPSLHQDRPSDSIPTSSHDRISSFQYHSTSQTGPSVSIPASYPQNPIPNNQDRPSDSVPTSSHDRISSFQHPSLAQTGPSASITTNHPQNPTPSNQNPTPPQDGPSDSNPTGSQNRFSSVQYPSISQTRPSVLIPTNHPQMPIPSAPQDVPSVSVPTSSHNSSAQCHSVPQTGPSVSIPINQSDSTANSHDHSMPQNEFKDKEITHFSHPHKLSKVTLQEDEENEVICSGCEETIVGDGYSCIEPDCDFHLHESCFHLKQEIHHKSHLEHPLTLLPIALYNKNGEFTCGACFSDGTGFTYHCSICKFDLHVPCVSLPETVKRPDHKHPLKLFYSCPVKDEDYTFYCDVCHDEAQKDRWVYYCEPCDYGTHLGCVDCEECERDSILDTQAQLQRLQLQMEMARQNAQFMASMGSSLASLAG
ncbi:uncharacterized protein LOC143632018 [Bidens hawaiensis]|uniref:uncharacterized protein LOC143632018 n=1 Tax=Bidens hawaiensis TaxID=980011 RepID=UPI004049953D